MLSILHFSFFFFKQKTAYEMRISDWSADVCSSDLRFVALHLGQLDQFGGVVALFLDRARRGHRLVEPATLAHHLLRRLGIVPQRRVLDLRIELVEPAQRAVPVEKAAYKREGGIEVGRVSGGERGGKYV